MAVNLDQIDSVLRTIDREVWVVTTAAADKRGGLTATWISPASIDRQRPVLLAGIAPNHFTAELIEQSQAMCTALAPEIGYDAAAQIAKESFATGKTVRQIAQERQVLPADRLAELLDPRRMTEPGLTGGPAGG